MSTLKLRSRLENEIGIPAWHDGLALQHAINFSSRGKPMSQLGIPLLVGGKIQAARATAKGQVNAVLEIELSDGEGKAFWEVIKDLPPEAFWPGVYPPILTVREMLDELKEALDVT